MLVYLTGCLAWLVDGGPGPRGLFHAGLIDGAGTILLGTVLAVAYRVTHLTRTAVTAPDPAGRP